MTKYTDEYLENQLHDLEQRVKSWAKENGVWYDAGIKTWARHFHDEPWENPCLLVFWFENDLCDCPELEDQLSELFEPTPFCKERYAYTKIVFFVDPYDDKYQTLCEA